MFQVNINVTFPRYAGRRVFNRQVGGSPALSLTADSTTVTADDTTNTADGGNESAVLLLEDGDQLLSETGDSILLEDA